jgi:hypothetical protein
VSGLSNEFSWSVSRHETLRTCARRYFFQYYRSFGGWDADADPTSREAYRLKNLATRASWVGTVVHRAVATALQDARAGHALEDVEAFVAEILAWMRQDYADSRDDVARRTGRFKQHVRFLEHEREHDASSPQWKRAWKEAADGAAACLRSFFASAWWGTLKNLPEPRWIHLEDPARKGPSSFTLAGVTVYAEPDCAFQGEEGPVLVDWKTGRSSGGRPDALPSQALYLGTRGVEPLAVRALEVNLRTGQESVRPITPEVLAAFEARFEASVVAMRALLVDPARNAALPEGEFAFTPDERECRWCVFASICPRTGTPF